MYYAISHKNGIITGVQFSLLPITPDTFASNTDMQGQELIPVDQPVPVVDGTHLNEYNDDWTLKPLVWRIKNGYIELPPGYELIDGELVPTQVSEEDAPPRLLERVIAAESKADIAKAKADAAVVSDKAARVMFKALAQTDVITQEQALDNQEMFDQWSDFIGKTAPAGIFLQYDGGLFRVQQEHPVQEHYPPGVSTAALYTRIQPPNAGPEPWQNGQSYTKGVEVTHNGGVWLSGVDNNTYEPGGEGIHDYIWKRVRDA